MNEEPWPGLRKDGGCPKCGAIRTDWDLEYHAASIGRFGLNWVATPGKEKLVALTCPNCKQKFKAADIE